VTQVGPSSGSPTHLEPGCRLARYQLLGVLGQGGMGSVWLARLWGTFGFEKLVAIKTLLPSHAADPRFRNMFLDEARIASGLVHGNVVHILDLGEADGWLYQAMEWVDGGSLRNLISAAKRSGERIPPSISLRIIADACAGAHAAHELRDRRSGESLEVVHRDISPANILVSFAGITKVGDFGIAKAKGRLTSETLSGDVKGKIGYMAPEQALGRGVDRRADLWSLGAVLYELLSGNRLFESSNEIDLLRQLISTTPKLQFDETIPEPIACIVRRAVRPHPNARYGTAADMERALRLGAHNADLVADVDDIGRFVTKLLGQRDRLHADLIDRARKVVTHHDQMSIAQRLTLTTPDVPRRIQSATETDSPPAETTIPELSAESLPTGASGSNTETNTSSNPTHALPIALTVGAKSRPPRMGRSSVLMALVALAVGGAAAARVAGRHAQVAPIRAVSMPSLSAGPQGLSISAAPLGPSASPTEDIDIDSLPQMPPELLASAASPTLSASPAGSPSATIRKATGRSRAQQQPPTGSADSPRAAYQKIDDGFFWGISGQSATPTPPR
jgi:eukaryotic-like serine/threonine-protein kinase